jgi:hypothetical protein
VQDFTPANTADLKVCTTSESLSADLKACFRLKGIVVFRNLAHHCEMAQALL